MRTFSCVGSSACAQPGKEKANIKFLSSIQVRTPNTYRVDLRGQLSVVLELERIFPDRLGQDELVLDRLHFDQLVDVGVDVRVEPEHTVWQLLLASLREGEEDLLEE